LYPVDPVDVSADLVELAGADALVDRAQAHLDAGRPVQAIHLAEKVTDTDPDHAGARQVLKSAHERLLAGTTNFWETAWLRKQIANNT
jgi:alkyl sulfatase BDS1-like metallo-beta-lactamase superfamily hydrolase